MLTELAENNNINSPELQAYDEATLVLKDEARRTKRSIAKVYTVAHG